jgi:hypothetical protein
MDGRQIVLVLTAELSVLNTEIFRLEALRRFTVFTQLQSRMSGCLSSTSSLSKILFLPTYLRNNIYICMDGRQIVLVLIENNILWIRKINVFQLYFCHCNRTYIGRAEKNVKQHLSWNNNMLCIKKNKCFPTVFLSL